MAARAGAVGIIGTGRAPPRSRWNVGVRPTRTPDLEFGIQTFMVNGHPVRGLKVDGKAAVYGTDFAAAMGYADPKKAIARHCKGGTKRPLPTAGGIQDMVVIFQGDINRLSCNSELETAQEFGRCL